MTNKLKIIDMLSMYMRVYEVEGDPRHFAYRKAIESIKSELTDDDTVDFILEKLELGIQNIGSGIGGKIKSLLLNDIPEGYGEIVSKYYKYDFYKDVNPHKHYMPRSAADNLIRPLKEKFKELELNYVICGSFRRKSEVVGDLDILIVDYGGPLESNLSYVNMILHNFNQYYSDVSIEFLAEGSLKSKIEFKSSLGTIEIDFRSISLDQLGTMLLHFTGPRDFNIKMRRLANKMGFSLSEYGLKYIGTDEVLRFSTEREVFEYLGLEYVKPEDRR